MSQVVDALTDLASNVVAFVVMIVLAVLSFFLTVFVVDAGAGLAGYTELSGDFVVLSAALLVAATIIAGIMNN